MQFDVVTKLTPSEHFGRKHADAFSAGSFCRQERFIGTPQQIQARVFPGDTGCDTDAHGAVENLITDGHVVGQLRAQPLGELSGGVDVHRRRGDYDELVTTEPGDQALACHRFGGPGGKVADELISGVVTEMIVDRLEPVKVEEQQGHRPCPPLDEAIIQMRQEGSAIGQCGQIIVFSLIAQPILDGQAGLDLGEYRGDHRERIELVPMPFPVAELDKPERSGGDVTG
jgi:hypothetical protein